LTVEVTTAQSASKHHLFSLAFNYTALHSTIYWVFQVVSFPQVSSTKACIRLISQPY